ncbi:hypothetical protein B0909_26540 [Rhizobium rhizogenes]|nr:hypothetical protein B0909_26540 [Rhizobium rhizogenes]
MGRSGRWPTICLRWPIPPSPPIPLISVLVTGIQPTRSARRRNSFSPRTWAGWIPVTSTGMREEAWWTSRSGSRDGLAKLELFKRRRVGIFPMTLPAISLRHIGFHHHP